MRYRKWSVPAVLADQAGIVCKKLGHTKRGDRWRLFSVLLAYAEEHPAIFRKR